MAATRSQSLLKEAMMNETEEVLESRLEKLQETIDDQNAKIGERIHALLLLLRSRKANEENHEDQSLNDKELGKAEVATKSTESVDPTVKNEANAKVISAIVKEESILQTQVPIVSSTPKLNFETEDIKSGTQSNYGGLIRLENVDFLRFDGDKIREWLFKVEEFFEIAGTPDGLKICVASAHFDGLAATWHQSFVQSKLGRNDIHDWNSYKMLLEGQFEEVLDDPIDELKQLRETNGIAEYHTKFELLRTRVNLTEDELVRSFLDGLQPETQANVEMFQPQTVSQCLSIGRLYEQAHPKMVSNQAWSGSKWSGNGNQLKGIQDCEEDQFSRDDNELVNIEVTVSTDLLLSKETNSPPHIAIGCELEAGVIDLSINQNQLIQEEAKNHFTDSFQETSLLQHKNSLLKHQVSISHWEFSHRSPIECLDVYQELPSASIASQVFDSLPLRMKLLRNRRMTTFSKNWCFKFKELDVRQEDVQNAFIHMSAIEIRFATTFKDVRLMRQTHMSRMWREVWLIQTFQDLQQFALGEVRFQIKHKWRFKLLHLVFELKFSLESVACVSLSDDQCDHCVVVRTRCVWTTQMQFGSESNHVWHRWKARWSDLNHVGMVVWRGRI